MNILKKQLKNFNQNIKEITSIYHNIAIKLGVSDGEFWVMYALLVSGGEYSQQNICDMWSLPKQTVNSVISNLKKKGYVFLETVPKTRNFKIIRLTQAGKAFGENTVMRIFEAEQRTFSKMLGNERQIFSSLLEKYIILLREEIKEL